MNNVITGLKRLRADVDLIRKSYLVNIVRDNFQKEDFESANFLDNGVTAVFKENVFLIMNSDIELVIYFLNCEWRESISRSDILMTIRYYINDVRCTIFDDDGGHDEENPLHYQQLSEAQKDFLIRNKSLLDGLKQAISF